MQTRAGGLDQVLQKQNSRLGFLSKWLTKKMPSGRPAKQWMEGVGQGRRGHPRGGHCLREGPAEGGLCLTPQWSSGAFVPTRGQRAGLSYPCICQSPSESLHWQALWTVCAREESNSHSRAQPQRTDWGQQLASKCPLKPGGDAKTGPKRPNGFWAEHQ